MKKKLTVKKCISMVGIMSLALTACGAKATTQPANAGTATEATATESSAAEALTGFAEAEALLEDGDVYTYVSINGKELLLHASDATTDESGKTYASAADVIGIDTTGTASMYGFANSYLNNSYVATDGEHFYSVTDAYIIKYDLTDTTLYPSEYVMINEVTENAEDGTSTTKMEYLYSIDGEAETITDDSKYQEMLAEYQALEPIEFKIVGDSKEFKYSDLSTLLYPEGVTYEGEMDTETDVNYDDQVATLPELSEENPIVEAPEEAAIETSDAETDALVESGVEPTAAAN